MTDTTSHFRCTKCTLPCDVYFDAENGDTPKALRGQPRSLCCKATVVVVGGKE